MGRAGEGSGAESFRGGFFSSVNAIDEGWRQACSGIEKTLRQDLSVTSLMWMTKNEASQARSSATSGGPEI
jgi:hypothetical protein